MDIDPGTLKPRDRYKLMTSVIQPRPIAWVSTQDGKGRHNIAPYSFFTGITASPMTLCFAPACDRKGRKKDTLLNIEETGEFVVNVVAESMDRAMVATSAPYPRGTSEFEKCGLIPAPSAKVKPPRVQGAPVSLECSLDRVVTVSEGPLGGNLVIGTVVHVHVRDELLKDGRISHKDLKPLGRLEGTWYSRVRDDYEIPMPGTPRP